MASARSQPPVSRVSQWLQAIVLASAACGTPADPSVSPSPNAGTPEPTTPENPRTCPNQPGVKVRVLGDLAGETLIAGSRSAIGEPYLLALHRAPSDATWRLLDPRDAGASPDPWPHKLTEPCGLSAIGIAPNGTVFAATASCWVAASPASSTASSSGRHATAAQVLRRAPDIPVTVAHTLVEPAVPLSLRVDAGSLTVLWSTIADDPTPAPPDGMLRQPNEPGPSLLTRFDHDGQLTWSQKLELGAEQLDTGVDGSVGVAWPRRFPSSSPTTFAVYGTDGGQQWTVADGTVSSFTAVADGTWVLLREPERPQAGHSGRPIPAPRVEQWLELRAGDGTVRRHQPLCSGPCWHDVELMPGPSPDDRMVVRGKAVQRGATPLRVDGMDQDAKTESVVLFELDTSLVIKPRYALGAARTELVTHSIDATWVVAQCGSADCRVGDCTIGSPHETLLLEFDWRTPDVPIAADVPWAGICTPQRPMSLVIDPRERNMLSETGGVATITVRPVDVVFTEHGVSCNLEWSFADPDGRIVENDRAKPRDFGFFPGEGLGSYPIHITATASVLELSDAYHTHRITTPLPAHTLDEAKEYVTRPRTMSDLEVTCFEYWPNLGDDFLCDDVCDGEVCFAPGRGFVKLFSNAAPGDLTYVAPDLLP